MGRNVLVKFDVMRVRRLGHLRSSFLPGFVVITGQFVPSDRTCVVQVYLEGVCRCHLLRGILVDIPSLAPPLLRGQSNAPNAKWFTEEYCTSSRELRGL
jgi:hypothetical protein